MYSPFVQIVLTLAFLPPMYFMTMKTRLKFLTFMGAIAVLVFSPTSFWVLLLISVEALLLERVLRSLPKKSLRRQYLPYLLLINMFYTDFAQGFFSDAGLRSLAVGFSVIRVFMTTKQLLGSKSNETAERRWSVLAGAYFFPVLVVGPVFSGTALWRQALDEQQLSIRYELNYRKLFGGWILTSLIAPAIYLRAGDMDIDLPTPIPEMCLLFVYLFATFWGRSLISEGGAALAGFDVPQNFNKPWLAKDIKDFWSRWHISMSRFVTQYIFLPLNLRGVKPAQATVLAFVFMGLWHQVRPGYILWGLAHGVLVAKAPSSSSIDSFVLRFLYRIATLGIIVSLSYVANYAFK
jgi:D-alanyl-lipoteichoic acid acyltransferase DltB (MBOAT superfamily)